MQQTSNVHLVAGLPTNEPLSDKVVRLGRWKLFKQKTVITVQKKKKKRVSSSISAHTTCVSIRLASPKYFLTYYPANRFSDSYKQVHIHTIYPTSQSSSQVCLIWPNSSDYVVWLKGRQKHKACWGNVFMSWTQSWIVHLWFEIIHFQNRDCHGKKCKE